MDKCFPRDPHPIYGPQNKPRELTPEEKLLFCLVRTSMPKLFAAYDICGIQPICKPEGLLYTMKPLSPRERILRNIKRMKELGNNQELLNANRNRSWFYNTLGYRQELDIKKQVDCIEFIKI